MDNKIKEFQNEVKDNIKRIREDKVLEKYADAWLTQSFLDKYCYNFTWLGRPIIQYPQDIVAMQEIVWKTKPDLIIETGIAHGGSLIFYSSLMRLLYGGDLSTGHVLGIDIDIREHNRKEIEVNPMYDRITMFEGSSIDETLVKRVYEFIDEGKYNNIVVVLDSMHTASHVSEELRLYSKLVRRGGYLVVMDTLTEKVFSRLAEEGHTEEAHLKRQFGANDGPMSALKEFLLHNDRFIIDDTICGKLSITAAPSGYLKCILD